MTKEENMIIEACMAICGGIGALVGAKISTTPKGKEMNENLEATWDKYRDEIKGMFSKLSIENKED